ncbi:hypothetical protein [Candidatus Similichlamydia laticola]|uniref:Uncharacterized protein n=1 Tax=Candidatus Similichlamydia laticola TaxID=2170265 RepID=A0A369KD33_9BACT|nr:hypothetical protein [Candidatus Similichlamydia laticola]RDB31808.1 hypothetical protein HAT2_00083 [Candidatus Similichlamydia laticola]
MSNLPTQDASKALSPSYPPLSQVGQGDFFERLHSFSESERIEALLASGLLSFDPVQGQYFFTIREVADPIKTKKIEGQKKGVSLREELYQDKLISSPPSSSILSIKQPAPPRGVNLEAEHALFGDPPLPILEKPNAYFSGSSFGQLSSILRHLAEIRKRILQEENEFFLKAAQQVIAATDARLSAIEKTFQGEIALAQARYTSAIVAIVGYALSLAALSIATAGALFDRKPPKTQLKTESKKQKILPSTKQKKEEPELDIDLHKEDDPAPDLEIQLSKKQTDNLTIEWQREDQKQDTHPPIDSQIKIEQRQKDFNKRQAVWTALLDPSIMPLFVQAVGEVATAVKDGMSVQAVLLEGQGKAREVLAETWQKFSLKELEQLEKDSTENREEISALLSVARRLSQLSSQIGAWSIRV